MLDESDIALIKETRKEITQHRTKPITVYGVIITGYDPITREPITEPTAEDTKAVVTVITSAFKFERKLIDGISIEEGDLWVDIDLDDITELVAKDIESITYRGRNYTVLTSDDVGLGDFNRITMVARRTK